MDDDPKDIIIRAVPPKDLPAYQRLRLARVITDMLRGREFICDLVAPPDPLSPSSAAVNAKRPPQPERRDHAKYCRDRAEECRQLADVATSQIVRESYLRLARSYDAMAIEESSLIPIRRGCA